MFLLSIGLSFFYNWKVTLCLVPLGPACAVVMGLMGKVNDLKKTEIRFNFFFHSVHFIIAEGANGFFYYCSCYR